MGIKLTTEDFITKSKLVHRDKYDYSLVNYINSSTKVKIICREHGIFEQAPSSHLNKRGCPICSGNTMKTTESFIKDAKLIHGDRYDYSLVEYSGNKNKVKIICREHGVFEQRPNNHLNKENCFKCQGSSLKDTEVFINESKLIHGNKYDYSLVKYIKNDIKVKIICEIHGIFEQTPIQHLNNHGCAKCSGNIKKTTELFILQAKYHVFYI